MKKKACACAKCATTTPSRSRRVSTRGIRSKLRNSSVPSRLANIGLAVAVGLFTASGSANEVTNTCDDLAALATGDIYEKHVWSPLERFRQMAPACSGTANESPYRTYRGQLESYVLNNAQALKQFDPDNPKDEHESERLPSGIRSLAVAPYIVKRAADHQIVIINERHHAASDRLLTLSLLRPLFAQGFRYLAVEAIWDGDDLNERGYPTSETGYYLNDVVFAEMIRQALALGYKVVAYEHDRGEQLPIDESMNDQQTRDFWQAKNIVTRTLATDRSAKVLIHCGYAHAHESPSGTWTPMANYLSQATGIDPLSIDQTRLSERSTPAAEHPVRRAASQHGFVGDAPVVLADEFDDPIPLDGPDVDIQVVGLKTTYENGRPAWLRMGGLREPVTVNIPECAASTCIVEAVDRNQPDAIAYDRAETTASSVVLYLPRDTAVEVSTYALSGSLYTQRTVRQSGTTKRGGKGR